MQEFQNVIPSEERFKLEILKLRNSKKHKICKDLNTEPLKNHFLLLDETNIIVRRVCDNSFDDDNDKGWIS